jgi:acetoacetate decarboxylase
MPLTSPAPAWAVSILSTRISHHEYRTDLNKLQAVVPEPLEVHEPIIKYEFIRMPDSTGFGDYTETGQVIPVSFRGRKGSYSHCMFLNDDPPIAGGRELWGFPKKLAQPESARRNRHARRHAQLRPRLRRHRHDGLQAQAGRPCCDQGRARSSEFFIEDHTARRGFASWPNIIWKISISRALGPDRARSIFTLMRWRQSRNCPCVK